MHIKHALNGTGKRWRINKRERNTATPIQM